eukprot:6203390-Pleurochrysis_carterae.AAC.5
MQPQFHLASTVAPAHASKHPERHRVSQCSARPGDACERWAPRLLLLLPGRVERRVDHQLDAARSRHREGRARRLRDRCEHE